jgi:nucleotide-binding universal stress UspA family protein
MRILVCTDGSRFAEEAAEYAGRIFEGRGARALVLRVIPRIAEEYKEYNEYFEVFKEEIHKLRKLGVPRSVTESLTRCQEILEAYGLEVETATRKGKATDEILAEAEEGGYDLIVLASYGKGISKFKLASVSRGVVHLAKVPVLVVKGEEGKGMF